MDEIEFNKLVEVAMKIGFTLEMAKEYVAISYGLSDGDVINIEELMEGMEFEEAVKYLEEN